MAPINKKPRVSGTAGCGCSDVSDFCISPSGYTFVCVGSTHSLTVPKGWHKLLPGVPGSASPAESELLFPDSSCKVPG